MRQGDAQGFVALLNLLHTRLAAPWGSWVFRAQGSVGLDGLCSSVPDSLQLIPPHGLGTELCTTLWTRAGGAQTASHQPYLVPCAGTWVVKGLTALLSQHLSGLDGGGASDQ